VTPEGVAFEFDVIERYANAWREAQANGSAGHIELVLDNIISSFDWADALKAIDNGMAGA
jgi:hypothetical protein